IVASEKPARDRQPLQSLLQTMQPRGGTAYLDACLRAVEMLARNKTREKAAVVVTDGVDLHSLANVQQGIDEAKKYRGRIYSLGMGEKGQGRPVNSMLVLDRSLSMLEPADDRDKRSKIEALEVAAKAFVKIMPESARTTVLLFGSKVA